MTYFCWHGPGWAGWPNEGALIHQSHGHTASNSVYQAVFCGKFVSNKRSKGRRQSLGQCYKDEWVHRRMDRWIKQIMVPMLGMELKSSLNYLSVCLILAISKDILHLMMPPIQLFMVIIFFLIHLCFKGYTGSSGHSGSPLVIYKHVYKISGWFTSCAYFPKIHSKKCMWIHHSFDKGIST